MTQQDESQDQELPRSELLPRARMILAKVRRFRDDLQRDLERQRFGADDLRMELYSELLWSARTCFPKDGILKRLPIMPDEDKAVGGVFGSIMGTPGPSFVTQRILSNVERLLLRLDMLFGVWDPEEDKDAPGERITAREALKAAQSSATVANVLSEIQRRQADEATAVDARTFAFVRDAAIRGVLTLDFAEAQRAFYARAYKLSGVASAAVIEGMLTDALQWSEVTQHPDYERSVRKFTDQQTGVTNWRRASLFNLVGAAEVVGLLAPVAVTMSRGAADLRDTAHVYREATGGGRVGREEALLLLALVQQVYRDLEAKGAPQAPSPAQQDAPIQTQIETEGSE